MVNCAFNLGSPYFLNKKKKFTATCCVQPVVRLFVIRPLRNSPIGSAIRILIEILIEILIGFLINIFKGFSDFSYRSSYRISKLIL